MAHQFKIYYLLNINVWYEILICIPVECSAGNFGDNCAGTCGQCMNEKLCHHVTGNCEEGCLPGYKEPTCKTGNVYVSKLDNMFYISKKNVLFVYGMWHTLWQEIRTL